MYWMDELKIRYYRRKKPVTLKTAKELLKKNFFKPTEKD